MQKIKFEGVIQIPANFVLVEKTEYESLQNEKLLGKYWTLSDLENATNRKRLWLQENILYVPKFKKELEKFVHYPQYRGDNWLFQASKMAKFLEDNFYKIFNP
ncbi:MAG: DUF771 domain-containing protein [Lysinibacillus sp.]